MLDSAIQFGALYLTTLFSVSTSLTALWQLMYPTPNPFG